MKIYLVQHGKAMSKKEDPKRPLNENGKEETNRIANFLRTKVEIKFDNIFYSKKLRAKQTAVIFSKYLSTKNLEEIAGLKAKDDPNKVVDQINGTSEDLNNMYVSHLPILNKISDLLLTNSVDNDIIDFHNSAVLCLEGHENNWNVEWYLPLDFLR